MADITALDWLVHRMYFPAAPVEMLGSKNAIDDFLAVLFRGSGCAMSYS